jgi:hypothetical protein
MGNCLVTKLKSAVSDSSLEKLGEMNISVVNSNVDERLIANSVNGESIISIIESGFVIKDINGNRASSFPCDGRTMFFPVGSYTINITNKYALTDIRTALCIVSVDKIKYSPIDKLQARLEGSIENLASLSSITSLVIRNGSTLAGNFNTLINLPNITELSVQSPNIYGDIKDIANSSRLIYCVFEIINSSIEGSIEELVSSLKTVLGENQSKKINIRTSRVTFGELSTFQIPASTQYNPSLQWNYDRIYYVGDTWVWAKNAPASQITDWENAGKTVTVIS